MARRATPGFSNFGFTGLNPWTFTGFAGAFSDGYKYTLNSQSVDVAGNFESNYSTYTFTLDLSTPTSGVTLPANGGYSNLNTVTISGTADDRFCALNPALNPGCANPTRAFESGIASVTVAIADITTSTNWWNGGSFASAGALYQLATFSGGSSGTWSYTFPFGALTTNHVYAVVAKPSDNAGNTQVNAATSTFVFDQSLPVSIATSPVGSISAAFFLYGTANDTPPGLPSVVQLIIKETARQPSRRPVLERLGGLGRARPVSLSSGVIGSPAAGPAGPYAWSMDASSVLFDNLSTFTVTARALDAAGNLENAHGGPDITFYLQTPAAVTSVTAPPNPGFFEYGPNTFNPRDDDPRLRHEHEELGRHPDQLAAPHHAHQLLVRPDVELGQRPDDLHRGQRRGRRRAELEPGPARALHRRQRVVYLDRHAVQRREPARRAGRRSRSSTTRPSRS